MRSLYEGYGIAETEYSIPIYENSIIFDGSMSLKNGKQVYNLDFQNLMDYAINAKLNIYMNGVKNQTLDLNLLAKQNKTREIVFDKLETDDFIYFELQVEGESDQNISFTSIQTEKSLAYYAEIEAISELLLIAKRVMM